MKAIFSECGKYRYRLDDELNSFGEREWPLHICWIMLNPSLAGGKHEGLEITDPTNTRVRGFSSDWGYTSYRIVNLFAFISPDPDGLQFEVDPVGPDSFKHVIKALGWADTVVCAWGSHKSVNMGASSRGRYMKDIVRDLGKKPMCLGQNKDGSPKHPLYLPKNTPLREFV